MYARFVTGSSGGRADTAKRCVPKRRFRASAIRRGSAEHPRGNSHWRYAGSDLDRIHRCVGPSRRRRRRRQHRRTPSRRQRSTVPGWTSTSASRHRGHNHRNNSHNRRSAGRKRLFERARTPSWWRRARISSRRSRRVARADWTAVPVVMTARIQRRDDNSHGTVQNVRGHSSASCERCHSVDAAA
jgi:hypothetical protein